TVERRERGTGDGDWNLYLSYYPSRIEAQGRGSLNEVEVASGDFSTGPYYSKNPQLNWISENIFRLSDRPSLPESKCNVLSVSNDGASALSYLAVSGGSGEWFYILNLPAQASTNLYSEPPCCGGDLSWIEASGLFHTGERVSDGRDFTAYNFAGRYSLSVK